MVVLYGLCDEMVSLIVAVIVPPYSLQQKEEAHKQPMEVAFEKFSEHVLHHALAYPTAQAILGELFPALSQENQERAVKIFKEIFDTDMVFNHGPPALSKIILSCETNNLTYDFSFFEEYVVKTQVSKKRIGR